jgi:hypothetical protein
MSQLVNSPSNVQSYSDKKIGSIEVFDDMKGKVGSVRGNQYSSLDFFGVVGRARPQENTEPLQKPVDLVFQDVTVNVNHEHQLEKDSLPVKKINKSIEEQYLEQFGSQRGIDRKNELMDSKASRAIDALDSQAQSSNVSPLPQVQLANVSVVFGGREGIPQTDDFSSFSPRQPLQDNDDSLESQLKSRRRAEPSSAVSSDFALPSGTGVFGRSINKADDALNNPNISFQSRISSEDQVRKAQALGPVGRKI